jgi:hypothetical protein
MKSSGFALLAACAFSSALFVPAGNRIAGDLVAVVVVPAAVAHQSADERTARAVWAQAVAAKGGGEALHGIRNFVVKESTPMKRLLEFSQHKLDVMVCEPPGKWWEFVDYRPGKMGFDAHVVNRDKHLEWYSWGAEATKPLRENTNTLYLMAQYQYVYFLETAFVQPRPTRVTSAGQFDLVETDVDGQRVDFYLDRNSHLPLRIETVRTLVPPPQARFRGTGTLTYRYTLEQYRAVAGIQVPTRLALGGDFADAEIEVNLDLDPKLFETPPDNVTQADEWRRYLRSSPRGVGPGTKAQSPRPKAQGPEI